MILSLFLAHVFRSPRYVWSPSLDLSDPAIYSALLPRGQ
jgi:hypothetical protein